MAADSETQITAPAGQGALARAVGMVVSPGATLRGVVGDPRPFGILLIVALLIGLSAGLPQFTTRGRQAVVDMQVDMIERMTRQPVNQQVYDQMVARSQYSAYTTVGSTLVSTPVMALFFTALFWGLFNAVLGGTATFKQVLGIVAHSMVIMALGGVLAAPIQLARGTMSLAGPFTLAGLAPMLDETSFAARLLGLINVFTLWQIVVLAIGLGLLYQRRTRPIAITLVMAYLGLSTAGLAVFSAFTR